MRAFTVADYMIQRMGLRTHPKQKVDGEPNRFNRRLHPRNPIGGRWINYADDVAAWHMKLPWEEAA